jgi:hypothetical protein
LIDFSDAGVPSLTARAKEELKEKDFAMSTLNKFALPKRMINSNSSLASRRKLIDIPKLGLDCKYFIFLHIFLRLLFYPVS